MTDDNLRWGSFETRFGRFGAIVDEDGTMVRFRFHAQRRPPPDLRAVPGPLGLRHTRLPLLFQ